MNPRCFGILADKPPVLRKSWPINPRCFRILADKPPVLNPNFSSPWFGPTLMARKASARYVSRPHAPVTSESLRTALRSGSSCQENIRILVKIHPQGKQDPTSGQKKNSDLRQKYLCEPVKRPREFETRDNRGGLWRRFCRMETSLLIFLTLVSY